MVELVQKAFDDRGLNSPSGKMYGSQFLFTCSFFFFWPHCVTRGILVPRPGIEPGPTAVKVWSSNH